MGSTGGSNHIEYADLYSRTQWCFQSLSNWMEFMDNSDFIYSIRLDNRRNKKADNKAFQKNILCLIKIYKQDFLKKNTKVIENSKIKSNRLNKLILFFKK